MEKDPLKIQVIVGSTRQNRFSEKPARYVFDELKKEEGVEAELIDLRDWSLPFFDEPVSPSMNGGNYANELGKKWAAKVGEADGYIIVTPEYNHGYPAVLKNALDWVFVEWRDKLVGFVSYGSALGARSVEQLRQVAIELSMHPIRSAIHLSSEIYKAVMNEKVPVDPELFKPLRAGWSGDRVATFFNELMGLARALKTLRKKSIA
ncbi:NAD(P)H-dependent oxidoreductase [Candidatus Kaiserbacteria bacterium]|nr:NAD(P)H-dependent oxidoreductase [Candidatus Kaiserbacteria bacterium]